MISLDVGVDLYDWLYGLLLSFPMLRGAFSNVSKAARLVPPLPRRTTVAFRNFRAV